MRTATVCVCSSQQQKIPTELGFAVRLWLTQKSLAGWLARSFVHCQPDCLLPVCCLLLLASRLARRPTDRPAGPSPTLSKNIWTAFWAAAPPASQRATSGRGLADFSSSSYGSLGKHDVVVVPQAEQTSVYSSPAGPAISLDSVGV